MSDLPEPDIVADALREVREELNIAEQEPMSIRMVGLVEDLQMRHPEALFLVRLPINEQELRTRLDHDEHGEIVSAPLENHALESLRADPRLTPFALGVVEACLERVNSDSLGQT
jgi:ADP-ribose pyrophosphatase YjhB (NUDIX family)